MVARQARLALITSLLFYTTDLVALSAPQSLNSNAKTKGTVPGTAIKFNALVKLLKDSHTRALLPKAALEEADKGHYASALSIIKQSAQKNKKLTEWAELDLGSPINPGTYGLALLKAGDPVHAAKYLKQAVDRNPKDLKAALGLAEALEKKGDIYGAVPYLRTALKLDPFNQSALNHLARILSWRTPTHAEAERLLARDLQLHPDDLMARRQLATIESWTKNTWSKAIEQFTTIIKQDKNDTDSKLALGRLLSWVGQFRQAELIYSSYLAQKPKDEIARRELAKLLSYHSDSWPEAINQYDLSLKLNPLDNEAAYDRALLLAYTHQADASIAELTHLVHKNPFGLMRVSSVYGCQRARPVLFMLAVVQNWSSKWDEAASNLRKYLAKVPDDWGAQLTLAKCLSNQPSHTTDSLAIFDDVLARHPDCSSALMERSMLKANLGHFDEALPVLRAIAARSPFGEEPAQKIYVSEASQINSPPPILSLARVASWANHWDESEQAYKTYLSKRPEDAQTRLEMANILSYQPKRVADAMSEYTRILKDDPNNSGALLHKLILEALSGHPEEASLALQAVVEKESSGPSSPNVNIGNKEESPTLILARILSWSPHWDDAEKYYRQYLAKHSDDTKALMELATLLSYHLEKRDEAIAHFSKIIDSQEPKYKDLSNKARFRRALTYAWGQHYDKAMADLDSLIASSYTEPLSGDIQSAHLTPVLARAQILAWSGKRQQSEKAYEEYLATEEGAKDKIAKLELAELYAERKETYPKAMSLLNGLLDKDPTDFLSRQAKAKMLIRMGDLEPASREFDELLAEHPGYVELHKQAALSQELSGNSQESLRHWQQVLALRPNDPQATLAVVLALTKDGSFPAAERLAISTLAKNPKQIQPYIALAIVLKARGQDSRLTQLIDQALAFGKTRDFIDIANQLSGPMVSRPVAEVICQKILDKEPENPRANLLLACMQIWSLPQRSEGITHLKHYLSLHPDDSQAEAFLAEVYSWGKNRRESLAILDKLIVEYPNNLDFRNQHAKVLTWSGKLSQAIREYKSILTIDSKNVAALVGLGQCTNYNGDYFKAEKFLKQARQEDPKDAQAQLVSAINFNQMGRVDKALNHLQTVLTVAHEPRAAIFSALEEGED